MTESKMPVTPAIRKLRAEGVEFSEHVYRYEEHGGTAVSARELGVDEHAGVKPLVMEDESGKPLPLHMHAHREATPTSLIHI